MIDTAKDNKGMTLIVKTVTHMTVGFILLYGIYVTLNGDITPGGGFVGGVIIALSLVHMVLAFGKDAALKRLRSYAMRFSISVASLAFLYMVTSQWHGSYSHIVMPLAEMVIMGAGIFAIFVALMLLSTSDRDSE